MNSCGTGLLLCTDATRCVAWLPWLSKVKGQEVISAEVTDYVNQHGPNIKVTRETAKHCFGVGSCVTWCHTVSQSVNHHHYRSALYDMQSGYEQWAPKIPLVAGN